MLLIKRILFKVLGLRRYLQLISQVFFFSYKQGWLKNKQEYYCHYFMQRLIKSGDTIIDIGANLGYYTLIFAQLTGEKGQVYAVEPVKLFRYILKKHAKSYSNIHILPYALGQENEKTISMGLPASNKYLSHGRTRVMGNTENQDFKYRFNAEMRNPSDLFSELTAIDYIKCDIEGYEIVVIPEMLSLIEKFEPIVQIETDGENRKKIIDLLKPLGYSIFYIDQDGAKTYNQDTPPKFSGDLIFSKNDLRKNNTPGTNK